MVLNCGSGWAEKGGVRYYRDFHAKPVTGWLDIDGHRYFFLEGGIPSTGWLEQDGVTWYNELYIAYTPSHIYCVCCAAPQDDFDGLRPTFSQVLDTIQVTPVS